MKALSARCALATRLRFVVLAAFAPGKGSPAWGAIPRLARAWKHRAGDRSVRLTIVTEDAQDVTGEEALRPETATIFGPAKTIAQECPTIICNCIDIPAGAAEDVVSALGNELFAERPEMFVARRGAYRWVSAYERLRPAGETPRLREHGVFLITGGTGGVGQLLAGALSHNYRARLALVSRTATLHDAAEFGEEVLLIDADVADAETRPVVEVRGGGDTSIEDRRELAAAELGAVGGEPRRLEGGAGVVAAGDRGV